MSKSRKQWSNESMLAAVEYVKQGNPLREASRLYNVPLETLRRRTTGSVEIDCRPGPSTVLTPEEEDRLAAYAIEMAERGFGLILEDLMRLAFQIVEKSGRSHPFKNGMAGRGWMDAFRKRHPKLTLRTPQALSFCRAVMANKFVVDEFFAKLGALYGRLNLVSKPMQVYNIDETGISIVHKHGKVVSELGVKHVYSLTSAERGKTHTIVSCVSASGSFLPPMMIYPRKREVPESHKNGAVPGTVFKHSDNGWITQEIYLDWFRFFISSIPPCRPVLLVEDGHASHISIECIELARENDLHLLCLPAHTSHILQPLDIGVFASFKKNYSKSCRQYMIANPGRVITTDALAGLMAKAWPESFTPVNIMSGFKKCGVFPFNPGEVSDRMLAPSKSVRQEKPPTLTSTPDDVQNAFSPEKITLYEKRYEEGYDVPDAEYETWLKLAHLDLKSSGGASSVDTDSVKTHLSSQPSQHNSSLSNILKLPEPKAKSSKRKPTASVNSRAVCLNDSTVLEDLKSKRKAKEEAEQERLRKKQEREEKRQKKLEETERKTLARLRKRQEQYDKKKSKKSKAKKTKSLPRPSSTEEESDHSTECPVCCLDIDCQWICCDKCKVWYHTHCTSVDIDDLPDEFYCERCIL